MLTVRPAVERTAAPKADIVLNPQRTIFADRLPVKGGVGRSSTGEDGLRNRFFRARGRTATDEDARKQFMAVAYEGPPFDGTRRVPILTVLSASSTRPGQVHFAGRPSVPMGVGRTASSQELENSATLFIEKGDEKHG